MSASAWRESPPPGGSFEGALELGAVLSQQYALHEVRGLPLEVCPVVHRLPVVRAHEKSLDEGASAGFHPTTIYKGSDDLRALFSPAIPAPRGVPATCAAGGLLPKRLKSATFSARAVSVLRLACG